MRRYTARHTDHIGGALQRHRRPLSVTAAAALAVTATGVVISVGSSPSGADTEHSAVSSVRSDAATPASTGSWRAIPHVAAAVGQPLAGAVVPARRAAHPVAHGHAHSSARTHSSTVAVSPLAADGIPVTAVRAYQNAARTLAATTPACGIPWPLLAGIGRVESDHGRYAGDSLQTDGTSSRKILGPVLDGDGTAVIPDTDGGRLDGNTTYDRAVGPLQFIPSTWARYASDGNGDGVQDPFNIFDEAVAAAKYLCAAGGDLTTAAGQQRAVFSYNHLDSYVRTVLGLEHAYATGTGIVVPDPPAVASRKHTAPKSRAGKRPVAKVPGHRVVSRPVTKTPAAPKLPVTKLPVTKLPVTKLPVTKHPVSKPPVVKHPSPAPTPPATNPPPVTTTPGTSTPPTGGTTPPVLTCPTGTQPITGPTGTGTPPAPGSQPAITTVATQSAAATPAAVSPDSGSGGSGSGGSGSGGTDPTVPVGCVPDPVSAGSGA